jgi:hypothetical protein
LCGGNKSRGDGIGSGKLEQLAFRPKPFAQSA